MLALLSLLAFLGLSSLLAPPRAQAQHPPIADLQSEAPESSRSALPEAPEDFAEERNSHVRWEFPESARTTVVRELQHTLRTSWGPIRDALGGEIDDEVRIRIGRSPEEMAALAPPGAPPPPYATGVAYPGRGLILLTLAAPSTWERPDMSATLRHELVHIALHRRVGDQPIPRWFDEGMAMHLAGEENLDRIKTLWSGTVSNQLIPLERMGHGFPSNAGRLRLAYAQSGDFIRWLFSRDQGRAQMRRLLGRVRRGVPFERAIDRTYAASIFALELSWRETLNERFRALPLLLGSGGIWLFAALLMAVAYMRKRRREKKKLKEWEEIEEAEDQQRLEAILRALPEPPEISSDLLDDEVIYIVSPEPPPTDSGIPTIEHEGRSHTLH